MLENILFYLREHGIKYLFGAAFGAVAWWLGNRRARARWQKREFGDRLNVSLNILTDGRLFIRTILEKSLSEKFADGQVKRDLGLPVTCGSYVMCLTYESAGQLKTRKVRAMMIKKETLQSLPTEPPKFTSEHHITRWETLHKMKAAYEARPWQFISVEICV